MVECEYKNGKKWNREVFFMNEFKYELKDGKGIMKKYYTFKELSFEGEYINGEIKVNVKNILKMEIYYLKVNTKMEKNGMEKDMIIKVILYMN